jgi:hypothetical protein
MYNTVQAVAGFVFGSLCISSVLLPGMILCVSWCWHALCTLCPNCDVIKQRTIGVLDLFFQQAVCCLCPVCSNNCYVLWVSGLFWHRTCPVWVCFVLCVLFILVAHHVPYVSGFFFFASFLTFVPYLCIRFVLIETCIVYWIKFVLFNTILFVSGF